MKWILLILALLMFSACKTGENFDLGAVVKETVAQTDRDRDGQVTKEEVRAAGSDPMVWLAIGSTILGALGLGGAASASKKARQVEIETDEQWEELKRMQIKP